jgi:Cdc6-like AAA superfamily ATPase
MGRVNAAWIKPVSIEPALFVNRTAETEDLLRRLEELREAQEREAHFLITGARGVGKSVFTRTALERFVRKHADHVVCITVDSRGLRYRPFLNRLANQLVEQIRSQAEKTRRPDLAFWLDQLALLANNTQVTRTQTETVARKYGIDAKAGLLSALESKLSWEETRTIGRTDQLSLTVTDDLLHSAIVATLERLAQHQEPWFIVLLFDDLDQASVPDQEDDISSLFRHVLDLRPCISLVHFRTEAMIENVKREATEKIDLKPLSAEALFEILMRRLQSATEAVRAQFPPTTDWRSIRQLAGATGNPLVFLRWVHGLLRTQEFPPPAGWTHPHELARLVYAEDPMNGAEEELVQRLINVVDRCDAGRRDRAVQRDSLQRGCLPTDNAPGPGLTEQEIEDLIKLEVLLPMHRFQPSRGYRIQPILDLMRPSVQERL